MKTTILCGNPRSNTLSEALAEAYAQGLQEVEQDYTLFKLSQSQHSLQYFQDEQVRPLEQSLLELQKAINESNHLVFIYPTWWGSVPGEFKATLDRVFHANFAFKYENHQKIALLEGKTASIITTMDAPVDFYEQTEHAPGHNYLEKALMNFCGVTLKNSLIFSPAKHSTPEVKKEWFAQVKALASQ
jgi:putative NADPH-quinone reductase